MSAWRYDAQCADDDPARYVLDEHPHLVDKTERQDAAASLCSGCPVMRDCAVDAMLARDFGVVRAGVWLEPGGAKITRERRRRLAERSRVELGGAV